MILWTTQEACQRDSNVRHDEKGLQARCGGGCKKAMAICLRGPRPKRDDSLA